MKGIIGFLGSLLSLDIFRWFRGCPASTEDRPVEYHAPSAADAEPTERVLVHLADLPRSPIPSVLPSAMPVPEPKAGNPVTRLREYAYHRANMARIRAIEVAAVSGNLLYVKLLTTGPLLLEWLSQLDWQVVHPLSRQKGVAEGSREAPVPVRLIREDDSGMFLQIPLDQSLVGKLDIDQLFQVTIWPPEGNGRCFYVKPTPIESSDRKTTSARRSSSRPTPTCRTTKRPNHLQLVQ